jgi:hypothetical protein
MQKHKSGIMCPDVLFVASASDQPEQEKLCIDISCPRYTRMHYVTRKSRRMQKHRFGITCACTLFMASSLGQPEDDK